MRYIVNNWIDAERDLNVIPILQQAIANEDEKATIDATVDAFFKGKAKVVGPFDGKGELKVFGNNIAGTLKAPKRIAYKDKDNPRLTRYRFEEKDATAANVLGASLCTRDEFGSTSTVEGDPIKPWVHLVFEDGSQVDLEAIGLKTKRTKTTEPAAGATS